MTHFHQINNILPQIDNLPDAIFWDWDGTVVDSYSVLNEAHNFTLRNLGMRELGEGEFKNYFGKERTFIFRDIYGERLEKAIEIFQNAIMDNSHMIKPFDCISEVLRFLKEQGVTMGIITNKKRCFVEKELEHTRFKKFLPIVVCSAEAAQDKPNADPLLKAIKQADMDVDKHEIWYVGDTETDLKCAKNARCKSVFKKGHRDTPQLLEKYSPFISFDNYCVFKDFLVAI